MPDDGKIFVQVDQSGAEALVVAYLCEKATFRDLFENGIKPHVYVALRLFKDAWHQKLKESKQLTSDTPFDIDEIIATPIKEITNIPYWKMLDGIIKDSDNWSLEERYYYLAKQTCHSSNYGINPPTFRMNVLEKSGGKIVISKEDSEYFISTYHALFPEIQQWHRLVEAQVNKTKMLYNLHGHPFTFTEPEVLDSKWKELYAWNPQSTVGEITNIAYSRFQNYLEICSRHNTVHRPLVLCIEVEEALDRWTANELDCDILANTHDSYMSQTEIGTEQRVGGVKQFFINQTFTSPVDGVQFTMKSEAQAGYNWSPAKKDKNLEGLKEIK